MSDERPSDLELDLMGLANTYLDSPEKKEERRRQERADALEKAAKESACIPIEDFAKADLRAGTILAADRVPKSKKLIRMDVDFGEFKRQILGAIGEYWAPDGDEPGSLVGKQFLFLVNLPPRTMMGLESEGMILAAKFNEDGQDHVTLLTPFSPVPPGSRFG